MDLKKYRKINNVLTQHQYSLHNYIISYLFYYV